MSRAPVVGNVPAEFSSFVGRSRELSELRRVLASVRLVTLTGVGGVGKSRLALRLATRASRSFTAVWWVELAGLADSTLVPQAVCDVVGIRGRSARDPVEVLAGFLADRQALLVIDNCEHLLPAVAPLAAGLLRAARRLRVLTTSREVLQVPGEHVYPVATLPVPDLARPVGARTLARYPGLALFAERAAAARPGFTVTEANRPAVATVCQRLDGIPLAIELAAVQLRTLSLEQLAERLDDRFRLLSSGNRSALPRHRTLRAAVEWSFELCAKPERLCWVRASVFAGRFDLEAAERVCAGPGLPAEEVYEAVAGLVDKSVLTAEEHPGGLRYRLLDTLRDYGLERLREPVGFDGLTVTDEAALRSRHRDFYLELAERFNTDWFGPRQLEWAARIRAERENLRAALAYSLDTPGQQRAGLRLAGALYYFWYGLGHAQEGRYWLERALPADPQPSPERVRALAAYARVLLLQHIPAAAAEPARECVQLARHFDETFYQCDALMTHGLSAVYCDDLRSGLRLLEQAATLTPGLAGSHPVAPAIVNLFLGLVRLFAGELAAAGALAAEGAAICRARGDQWFLSYLLVFAMSAALALDEVAQATAFARETLQACRVLHDPVAAPETLGHLAWTAVADGDYPRAARLLGAADRQMHDIGRSHFTGPWAEREQQAKTTARQALGAEFDPTYQRGHALDLDEAVAYALNEDTPHTEQTPERSEPTNLTRREREVVELITQGRTNKEIAGLLVIAQRTAETHVENILSKLGFTSRAQVAAWRAAQPDFGE